MVTVPEEVDGVCAGFDTRAIAQADLVQGAGVTETRQAFFLCEVSTGS